MIWEGDGSKIILAQKMTCVNSIAMFPQGFKRLSPAVKYSRGETLYEKFGLNVVYYRKRKKLTQLQLAELVDIDRSHISAIELGNVGVSLDVVFRLCEVLEITPKELFDFR